MGKRSHVIIWDPRPLLWGTDLLIVSFPQPFIRLSRLITFLSPLWRWTSLWHNLDDMSSVCTWGLMIKGKSSFFRFYALHLLLCWRPWISDTEKWAVSIGFVWLQVAAARCQIYSFRFHDQRLSFGALDWQERDMVLNPTMWPARLKFDLLTHPDLHKCVKGHTFVAIPPQKTPTHTLSLRLVEQMWRRQQMCNVHPSIMEASHSWQGKQLSEWEMDALFSLCSTLTILTPSSHSFSSFSSVSYLIL